MKTSEALATLKSELENLFESERYRQFLLCMSRFYNYSFYNILLILSQLPTASIVASYTTWKQQKRWVKRGEKALTILVPMTRTEKDPDTGEDVHYTTFRARPCVFDISQTDGEELPDICHRLAGDLPDSRTLSLLSDISPVPVEYAQIPGEINGYFDKNNLCIKIDSSLSETMKLKTLTHEISHALLHGRQCEEEGADKRTMEVQAESVAFVVLNALGIDSSDYSFGYIAGWSSGKELPELRSSMETIRKTADYIVQSIEERMEKTIDT